MLILDAWNAAAMTPPFDRDQLRSDLSHAMDELRDSQNDDAILSYRRTRTVLHAIYDLERLEKARSSGASFAAECRKSNPGCTLLGVIWIRGKVVHAQQQFRELVGIRCPATQ